MKKETRFRSVMFTGASTGDKLDGELARANAIKFRTPYQSNKDLRALLNSHGAQYYDMHLSELGDRIIFKEARLEKERLLNAGIEAL